MSIASAVAFAIGVEVIVVVADAGIVGDNLFDVVVVIAFHHFFDCTILIYIVQSADLTYL